MGKTPLFLWISGEKCDFWQHFLRATLILPWTLIHISTGLNARYHLHLARLFATLIRHTNLLRRARLCVPKNWLRVGKWRGESGFSASFLIEPLCYNRL